MSEKKIGFTGGKMLEIISFFVDLQNEWISYLCKYLYFVDWITFYILGQNFVKFFVGFLENLRYRKDILKLTELFFKCIALCARETMRQYVGVASLVEILYLRLSSLSLPHTDTQYAVVVEGCQNEKKYKYLFKK